MPEIASASPKHTLGSASPHHGNRGATGLRSESFGSGGGMNGGHGGNLDNRPATAGGTSIFASALRNATPIVTSANHLDSRSAPASDETVEQLTEQLNKEIKIKEGAENLLQVLDTKKEKKDGRDARNKVERERNASQFRIAQLESKLEALRRPKQEAITLRNQNRFRGSPLETSPTVTFDLPHNTEPENSASTLSLSEILQCMEERDKPSEFYVQQANALVVLFRKHPALKYELSWTAFGPRIQFMLLHSSKDVVAAGYRMTRYALSDVVSLRNIRNLHTDMLIIRYVLLCSEGSGLTGK